MLVISVLILVHGCSLAGAKGASRSSKVPLKFPCQIDLNVDVLWDLFYYGYLSKIEILNLKKTLLTFTRVIAGTCFIVGPCLTVRFSNS